MYPLPAAAPAGNAAAGALFLIMIVTTSAAAYCAPLIVSLARRAPNTGQVAVVNLLLGWTVAGWIVALVMALKPFSPVLYPGQWGGPAGR